MRILTHPLATFLIGVVAGAKFAGTVNGLPVINKIPSR